MELLASWKNLKSDEISNQPDTRFAIRRSAIFYEKECQLLESQDAAESFVQLAYERALSHVGIRMDDGQAEDTYPRYLAVTLFEPGDDGDILYSGVFSLAHDEVIGSMQRLFRLAIPFVGYGLKPLLNKLWHLGIEEPSQVWDCHICEKALMLGRNHERYVAAMTGDDLMIKARQQSIDQEQIETSFVEVCRKSGVSVPIIYQERHADNIKWTPTQLSELASLVVQAYPGQVVRANRSGLLSHLVSVEMPWTITTARMEFNGVQVDQGKARLVRDTCDRIVPELERSLAEMGLANPRSNGQTLAFFEQEGLSALFTGRDGMNLEKRFLKRHMDAHPAIPLLIELRKMYSIKSCGLLNIESIGDDGRMHPEYKQLGAHTGRQTSKNPNILGVPGVLRPLVVPADGFAIGEVDLCQIEIGVAGAVYGDAALVRMFNEGDVYSSMAQEFYSDLNEEDKVLPSVDFKARHPDMRGVMKTCTLSIIYGSGVDGLASQLGTGIAEANDFLDRFMALFPALKAAQKSMAVCSERRGYSETASGLRRYRGVSGRLNRWEQRWMVNFPVQGGATVAFKVAGNRLDRLYQLYGAKLIVPHHDAFVFECPLDVITDVASLTGKVMCEAVQECFPDLKPRVDINTLYPSCWNKDGRSDSFIE